MNSIVDNCPGARDQLDEWHEICIPVLTRRFIGATMGRSIPWTSIIITRSFRVVELIMSKTRKVKSMLCLRYICLVSSHCLLSVSTRAGYERNKSVTQEHQHGIDLIDKMETGLPVEMLDTRVGEQTILDDGSSKMVGSGWEKTKIIDEFSSGFGMGINQFLNTDMHF